MQGICPLCLRMMLPVSFLKGHGLFVFRMRGLSSCRIVMHTRCPAAGLRR